MENLEREIWKPVPGYGGVYQVSSMGRILSNHKGGEHLLTPHALPTGHLMVQLHWKGNRKWAYVHRLVFFAFVHPIKEGWIVHHINGVPSDNTVGNLIGQSSRQHTVSHKRIGETHRAAKLTEADVRAIHQRVADGESVKGIAEQFGVQIGQVNAIAAGTAWKSLELRPITGRTGKRSRFSEGDRIRMIEMHEKEMLTYRTIAKRYSVGVGTAYRIINKKSS